MKIGIDVRALMEGRTTGVQVYIVNLLHSLFKLDKENEYILFANSYKKADLPVFDYKNVSYRITNYPNKIFNFCQRFFSWPKMDKIMGGLDLFFSPHWRTIALSPDLALVVTFHDLSYKIFPEFFTMRHRFWHTLMNYRDAAKRATKIIAVSQSTKKDLIDLYKIHPDKVEVIYSGINQPRKSKQQLETPDKYFLFLGTFEPRKNINTVLSAHREYLKKSRHRLPLVLAGSSGWKTEFAPCDKVYVYQDLSEEEKARFFEKAFAFLFLSFYEGFGFPVLEAASYGVPVISSFATSLSEIAKDFALFVNPLRPSQVARAMLEVEQSGELRESMSKKGIAAVQNFRWEDAASKTLELFNSQV